MWVQVWLHPGLITVSPTGEGLKSLQPKRQHSLGLKRFVSYTRLTALGQLQGGTPWDTPFDTSLNCRGMRKRKLSA